MLSDFITDLTREVEYHYTVDSVEKVKVFEVKGLSIKKLANIFNHKTHGAILLKLIEGIDINKDNKEDFKDVAVSLIDTNYASLVYHFVACCTYVRESDGSLTSCENQYELFDTVPFDLTVKLLTHALELTLPTKEHEVKKEIKKLLNILAPKKK